MSATDEDDRHAGEETKRSSSPAADRDHDEKKKPLPLWQEVLLLLATALILAIVVKTFLVQAFYIPSGSMEETLEVNDRILVQKVSYWTGDVERGDIVVFDDPGGWLSAENARQPHNALERGLEVFGLFPTGGHLVKRVIGVGGDHVVCCDRQNRITVNDAALNERYLPDGIQPSITHFDVVVPDGYLWVMGDNRGASSDSRAHMATACGMVAADSVVGKVWAIVWPASHARLIDSPDAFSGVPDGNSEAPDASSCSGGAGGPR